MARLRTAAGFIKHNMPLGQGNTLTDDEAFDVAWYVTRFERPDFADKAQDWPTGGKPDDARY
jgi:thiosulfate dehydrogenase